MNVGVKTKTRNWQTADVLQPGDVMSMIENNGEVTLPVCPWSEPFVPKRRSHSIALIAGALIFAGVLSRGKMFH